MYKQVLHPFTNEVDIIVKRLRDNAYIPFDPTNVDYQEYLTWVAEGNTPLPADEQ